MMNNLKRANHDLMKGAFTKGEDIPFVVCGVLRRKRGKLSHERQIARQRPVHMCGVPNLCNLCPGSFNNTNKTLCAVKIQLLIRKLSPNKLL